MTTEQKVIKNEVGLLSLAQELGNVSMACKQGRYPGLNAKCSNVFTDWGKTIGLLPRSCAGHR